MCEACLGIVNLYPGCNMPKACQVEYFLLFDVLGKSIRRKARFTVSSWFKLSTDKAEAHSPSWDVLCKSGQGKVQY
jgi:hypothetical protein